MIKSHLFAILFLLCVNITAHAQSFSVGQNPSNTIQNACQSEETCCDECRIIYITNNTTCCLSSVTIRGPGDSCFSVCGEVINTDPTRPLWDNTDNTRSNNAKTLAAINPPNDLLCPGMTLAVKLCADLFPFTIRIEATCNGNPVTTQYIVQ